MKSTQRQESGPTSTLKEFQWLEFIVSTLRKWRKKTRSWCVRCELGGLKKHSSDQMYANNADTSFTFSLNTCWGVHNVFILQLISGSVVDGRTNSVLWLKAHSETEDSRLLLLLSSTRFILFWPQTDNVSSLGWQVKTPLTVALVTQRWR